MEKNQKLSPPAWEIESEYPSLSSAEFKADLEKAKQGMESIARGLKNLDLSSLKPAGVAPLQGLLRTEEETSILLWNLSTYAQCLLSVNAADEKAQAQHSQIEELGSQLAQLAAPLSIYLQRCPEEVLVAVLADPKLKGNEFRYRRKREDAPFLLSEKEEVLLQALSVSGHNAWGNLYQSLTGKGKCHLQHADGSSETLGIAEAAALIYGPDEPKRKAAWHAIQSYWTEHRESAAAVANALAGWRHEVGRKRSHTKPYHFLHQPLAFNVITRETLDAILSCCQKNIEQLRRAPRLMAKTMKKPKLDPWDLLCPSPISGGASMRSFEEGVKIVRDAFHSVDPQMSEFLELMVEKRWIEARVLPTKAGGAHCTGFPKSLTPRVFQTYMGSLPDIMTLAHEVGHAFHSWVMRDLPWGEQQYPMTLAETASVFAETALRDALFSQAKSREEKLEFAWTDLDSIAGFLINIPVRFDYENAFYEKREKSALSADELSALMEQTWAKWYGDTLSQNDKMFWATKQHFSFAEVSFYNFPYVFGYLFSLSIYARRKELGASFMSTYVAILRDTGRMTAEALVQKHLGEDIRDPAFWQKAIAIEVGKLDRYEKILG